MSIRPRSMGIVLVPLAFLAMLLLASTACPAWTDGGVRLSASADEEYQPQVIWDGTGGAIVAWTLLVSGSTDSQVWVARLDAAGTVLWRTRVADYGFAQMNPQLILDGPGGAIVTWQMYPSFGDPDNDIYAARVSASGSISWAVNASGLVMNDTEPRIAPDWAGGFFIAWNYNGQYLEVGRYDVATGARSWLRDADTTGNNEFNHRIASDGMGNAVICWEDDRAPDGNWDVYASRMAGSDGSRLWGDPGLQVSSSSADDLEPQLISDGGGGAYIAYRNGAVNQRIKTAKVTAAGSVSWDEATDGVSLDETNPQIAPDATGGAFVTWQDGRAGGGNQDIYAQHFNGSGTRLWGSIGLQVSVAATDDTRPRIAVDGSGGAYITWQAFSGTINDICLAHLTGTGTVSWALPFVTGPYDKVDPAIARDGAGGAVVTWADLSDSGNWDILAQNTSRTITASAGPGGSITPAGPVEVNFGSSQAFAIIPEPGCHVTDVLVDGSSVGAVTSYTFTNVTSGHTIEAYFAMYDFYFAEGYTGPGFQEYLCLGNPGNVDVPVEVTYLFTDGTSQAETYTVPARSRFTADVNAEVGADLNVSIKCSSAFPYVAERPMYFDYTGGGGSWTGGHDAVGATSTSKQWFFAEGYTGPGFDEWICVLNPGGTDADLTFDFQTQEEGLKTLTGGYTVPAHSRATFKANDLLGGAAYQTSLMLTSDLPVVAERPMYFDYQGTGSWGWTGGHCVLGVPDPARQFYFAEGTTRAGFEEWLTIQNPGVSDITVNAIYQLGSGTPITMVYDIPAGSRATKYIPDEAGTEQDVSVFLSSASYFLAERPMYFDYQGTGGWGWTGGHCVIGAASPATDWFFAEGYTGENFEEWLCIQNSGAVPASVVITYYPEGSTPIVKDAVTIAANSRFTVNVNADAGAGLSLCAGLTSDQPVIVERPMYFNYGGAWTGGHDVVGYAP